MKISKRPIKAHEDIPTAALIVEEATSCPYEEAIDCIMCAINSLGAVAKEDEIARDSIANLSVVLFDLKG